MKLFKKIWKKIRGLFIKRPPTTEKIISEEKAVLEETIIVQEIYAKIQEANDEGEKAKFIKKIAQHETAKSIIAYVESNEDPVIEKKKGRKKVYELHELRIELQILEEKRAALDYHESKIIVVSYPDTSSFDNRINDLFTFLNKNKIEDKVELSDFSISSFDKSFQQLDKLFTDKSLLKKYKIRENEKQRQEEFYRSQIKQKISILETYINQNNLVEAKSLINILTKSIKPNYEKEQSRLSRAKDKLKEKEILIFKRQQEEILKQQAEQARKIKEVQEQKEREQRIIREQELAKQKIEEDKKAEKERKLRLLLSKRANWRDFQKVLQENGITAFYHFTDIQNLKSIKENEGLYSWHYADANSIIINFPGGDTLSRDLDKRYGLQDYVRVSLCTDHPMQYRLEQRGRKLVLLKVDIEVAYYENTIFCNINATDSNHKKGTNIEDLNRIRFSATKKRFVSRDDPDFKHHQAEVLVKTWIPLEHISNINNFA